MKNVIKTNAELISKIKEKKELSDVSNQIVEEALETFLGKYELEVSKIKQSHIKVIVKEVRATLRNYTGQFQKSSKSREKLLSENKITELLKTHTSTSERIGSYPELKKIINELKIKSILDLGCGLNPIAISEQGIKYFATDIKEDELSLIQEYFDKNKIDGETFVYDIRKVGKNLPSVDLCIVFKVLDIVGKGRVRISDNLLREVSCEHFLISFPTKKLSGRSMNRPKRIWFEKLLEKNNFFFKIIETENEIFYLASRHAAAIGIKI